MSIEENGTPSDIVEFAECFLGIKFFKHQKVLLRLMGQLDLNEKIYRIYQPNGGDIFVVGKSQVDDLTVEPRVGDMFTYGGPESKFSLIDHNTTQVKMSFMLTNVVYAKKRWYEFFKKKKVKQYVFRTMMKA